MHYATPGGYGYPGPYNGPAPSPDDRTWGMLAHLSSLAGFVVPLGNIVGPLVVWLVKKDRQPFVDDQGKESLNFQILVTIAVIICIALWCLVIGIVLLPIVGILALVFEFIAAVKAYGGEAYRYPVTLRLIK